MRSAGLYEKFMPIKALLSKKDGDRLRPSVSIYGIGFVVASVPVTISYGGVRMIKRTLVGCLALIGLLASVSLQAHHSLAGVYDMKADKELSGTVKSIKFVNPHGTLTVTVKNADGTTADWILSMGSATSLAGLRPVGVGPTGPNALRFGDAIKVRCIP